MTVVEQQEVEALAAKILHRYFRESDVDFLISTFTPDIVWLGGAAHHKAEGAEAVARCFLDSRNALLRCRMWDEEYIVVQQAPGVYLCEGRSWLESLDPGTAMRIQQRITFIFRRDADGRLKTAHIHNSVPFDSFKSHEMFPIEAARETFRKLQHRLNEQDRQIELMLRHLPGGMMICYPDEPYTTKWISEGLCRMLGYGNLEDYRKDTGNNCKGFLLPEDYAEARKQVRASFLHGDTYSVEYRVRRRDGSIFWALDIGKRFVDADGETVISCFITDISDRVVAERQLRRANQENARQARFLSRLYNTVPCGIIQFVMAPVPQIITLNRSALDIYGCAGPEYESPRDPFFMVMDRDRSQIRQAAQKIFHGGGRHVYERKLVRGDGSARWISVIMEQVVNPDGLRVIQAIFTDITDKKKLELEREQEQLIEHRSLRAAVCSAYQLIIRVNLSRNRYESFNEQDYITQVEPVGNFREVISKAAGAVSSAYREAFAETFSLEGIRSRFERGDTEIYMEYQRLGDDGKYHWLSMQCIRVESPRDDEPLAILMIKILDEQRAEKARQEQLLRDALAAARAASRAKSDFLSRMSHDIRTPMNAIIGMSALGQLKLEQQEYVLHCFHKIDASCRYLLSLINDILDMSRIESGKVALSHKRFDFTELISQVDTIIYPQTVSCGIAYEVYHEEPLERHYIGDALRINQILMNLLSNALKFTPAGGKISVHIREQHRANGLAHLEFVIRDTGVGMSEEFMQRIFQPFEQENTDGARNKVGTGLGLSIVANLIQLMGGSIDVQSEKTRGTAFTVILPLGVVTEDAEKEQERKSGELLSGLRVLVADDDGSIGEQVVAIMKDIGAESFWVDSGFKAVEAVRTALGAGRRFDVALIDWKMPGMDGIETTRQIRRLVGPDTTIIIITAYDWSAIEAQARAAGADHFLAKPLFRCTLRETFLRLNVENHRRPEGRDLAPGLAGKRLLLVEDNEINMEIAKSLLEMHGLRVESAENGEVAVQKFREAAAGRYQAILMDIRMPVLDGLEATRAIRNLSKADARDIPIIAMSANAFEEDKALAAEAGMNDYLVKPIDLTELFASLERWL